MARIPIIMPKMSMTMTEGEVATWLVKIGDHVDAGDVIAEVMTDKVDMEVESTHTGTLIEITAEDGMVAVGDPIGYLEGVESGFGDLLGGDDEPAADEPAEHAGDVTHNPTDGPSEPAALPGDPPVPGREPSDEPARELVTAAVPRARGLARERGLDLDAIDGTGPDGLVTVADVEAATRVTGTPPAPPEAAPAAGSAAPPATTPPAPTPPAPTPQTAAAAGERTPQRDRSSLIRAAVARKMIESATVPQFTVWRDIRLDEANARRQGLSWTTVLLRAYAAALRDVPELLCRWQDGAATPSGPPAIALAVATEGGLMVPVFTEPDRAAPRELDQEVKSVVSGVQQGRLDPAYLGVANGSLSNLGGLGVDRFQALVTPPQASVLALGSVAPRPTAVPGGVGLALTLTAGLTVDHRVADGAQAARLLERLVAHIG